MADALQATRTFLTPFFGHPPLPWLMEPAEQFALIALLQLTKPDVAIEIGTAEGGSLQVLAKLCRKVYSIDMDSSCTKLKPRFPNVEFITGMSAVEIPKLLTRLQSAALGFVLVDGNHTEQGVRADLAALLAFVPRNPLHIVMHDSFHPSCRRGIANAPWAASAHVHAIELDFVPGILFENDEMWGGLALARLDATKRGGPLTVNAQYQRTFDAAIESIQRKPPV